MVVESMKDSTGNEMLKAQQQQQAVQRTEKLKNGLNTDIKKTKVDVLTYL